MYESPSLHRFIKSPSAASQTFAVPRLASRLVHYNYNGTRLGLGGGDPGAVELPCGGNFKRGWARPIRLGRLVYGTMPLGSA